MRILNFGSCNIDYTYTVDHIVTPGETAAARELELFCGGKGLNQSIAAAKAGASVYHIGYIGSDGHILQEALLESGVDVTHLKTVNSPSGHAIIQISSQGENSILVYSGANALLSTSFIDRVLEQFSAGDLVLLQNETSNVPYIVEKAYAAGLQIALNPAPFNQVISQVDLSKLTYLILNEVEGKCLTGQDAPDRILNVIQQQYPNLKTILTLGKKGCIYAYREERIYQPAFQVEAIDTTAAGDTFIGFFLAAIAADTPCSRALQLSCAASALSVCKKGAAPSIPTIDQVLSALIELKPCGENTGADLIAHIQNFFEENIGTARIGELAKRLNYSETYTGEIIKRLTGKTFSQLLQESRCAAAAKLLLETQLPVGEIIHTVGYQNESFFRQKFQELYGATPLQYRLKGQV